MFQALRQTFQKIRAVIRAVRVGIVGLLLVAAAWVFLSPPTQTEIVAMALPEDATAGHLMLRAHRMAKLLQMVESDRLYAFIAAQDRTGMTAEDIAAQVKYAANGIAAFGPEATGADAIQKAHVSNGGAKFVPARTN